MATNLIRDPVHDFISFSPDDTLDQFILELIKLPEFQRLRRISQLGFTSLVYPGGTHSRFSHSLGVMHVARQMVSQLKKNGNTIKDDDKRAVICSALLHDLGHGPFSHSFEKIMKTKHVVWSEKIIKSESVSNKLGPELTQRVVDFINPTLRTSYLAHIISSQLDADRFDFLLRDNITTGAQYGQFDLKWILHCLRCNYEQNRLEVSHKGQLAIEGYLQARYHMYRNVYYHKTVRAAEAVLQKIFDRAKFLVGNGENLDVDPIFTKVLKEEAISVGEYIDLDDGKVLRTLCQWASGTKDRILSDLSMNLLNRELFKVVVDEPTEDEKVITLYTGRISKITEFFRSVEEGEFYWLEDEVTDTPYRPYSPDDKDPMTSIYIQRKSGEPKEISTVSKPIEALTKYYGMYRIFVHSKYCDRIKKILEERNDRK